MLWFTGLSGAGKSTIADLVEKKLLAGGRHTMLLDGDNVRHGLNRDLGFTDADRVENIRRVGEVAKLMTEAGLIVLCSFISPFRAERQMVRELIQPTEFIEIFVDTPLDECIRRDPKGLYAKARAGRLEHFTGLDSPYETPEAPELRVTTMGMTPESRRRTCSRRTAAPQHNLKVITFGCSGVFSYGRADLSVDCGRRLLSIALVPPIDEDAVMPTLRRGPRVSGSGGNEHEG